ncbi:MAG TPA: response regulator [Vicinamibacterales bacterium]
MRILIVDDSSMMRAMIKRVVKLTDVAVDEILEAGDGAEALKLLESNDVQLLLTDINMPVMNGADLLRRVAGNDRWRGLTRVIISTDGSTERREEAADLSVRCYLKKPFSREVLRDVLIHAAHAARP